MKNKERSASTSQLIQFLALQNELLKILKNPSFFIYFLLVITTYDLWSFKIKRGTFSG